ncbi:MAG: hypothetical protein ACKOWF_19615 [Chloroflexota bacterium]
MDTRIGRRSFAGVAAVAATAAVGFGSALAKGNGKSPNGSKPANNPPGKNKVAICHLDDDTGLYSYKLVPPTAVPGHERHGDVVTGVTSAAVCDALNQPPT